jgi:hypothetical protein
MAKFPNKGTGAVCEALYAYQVAIIRVHAHGHPNLLYDNNLTPGRDGINAIKRE